MTVSSKTRYSTWQWTQLLAAAGLLSVAACEPPPPELGSDQQAVSVSGAAFTTDNMWVDGDFKDVCKNSSINCNIYGEKPDVWLNGGPSANHLGPDGEYFFAVLVPGGQPDPNDGGAKNLSDDFDDHHNRTFTVSGGEVSAYGGTHDLDSGDFLDPTRKACHKPRGCTPDGQPPLIRLAPYADTTNPGGVYILAVCSLEDGYPVEPRDCKYDAFKVKEGPVTYDWMLSGIKFQDTYADGVKDDSGTDPALPGWTITVQGTGFAGEAVDATLVTDGDGYWDYGKSYSFHKSDAVYPAELVVCEQPQAGWYQSYPASVCYDLVLDAAAVAAVNDVDFGNWQPVEITACKVQDLDADASTTDDQVDVEGWTVSLVQDGVAVDTQLTGADGCYKWTDLPPGFTYGVAEGDRAGWAPLGDTKHDFGLAGSNDLGSHTFVNAVLQGCTPGFWQGGSDGGQAGGQWLWNDDDDLEWTASGGDGTNPYVWTTLFDDFFTAQAELDGLTMMDLVGTGGGPQDVRKAARSLVAAYLNASWGMNYPYSTVELHALWNAATASGDFLSLHTELDAANNAMYRTDGGPHCPVSASGF